MNEEIRAGKGGFQRAYLVGIQFSRTLRREVDEHLAELSSLVRTLGAQVVGTEVVRLDRPKPKYLVGEGKMEEIKARLEEAEADVLVFDDDLAAPQQHLWESRTKIAVIDRRKVIIDIFATRAQTREARLQVELANMEYTLPRLKRAWTHLERQRGGAGFIGGAGEAQIEMDRRMVRDRIARLKEQISEVRRHRENQRKARDASGIPAIALVGYTNTGKSSLLNTLSQAGVLAEDKLFATLDPTTRRITLPNNQEVLLVDTVGFIRKLPTTLVAAFKSTLEEAALADFLIHVVDASHPAARDQYDATNKVLRELGALDKPTVLVLNKQDLVTDAAGVEGAFDDFTGQIVRTSTATGEGLEELGRAMAALLNRRMADLHLRIPASRFDVVSSLHRDAEVLEQKYDDSSVLMHVLIPARLADSMEEYATTPW